MKSNEVAGSFHCLTCDNRGALLDCYTWTHIWGTKEVRLFAVECPRCHSDDVDCYGSGSSEDDEYERSDT